MAAPPLPEGFRFATPEVIYTDLDFVVAGADEVALLKRHAVSTPRRRCRLCAHPSPEAAQQEMLIAMLGESYVRPHRHRGKTESLTVLEGVADAVLFDEAGAIREVVRMTPYDAGGRFFYRMPEQLYHGLVFRTRWFVYLETTSGPFDPACTEPAPWAPPETEAEAGRAYAAALAVRLGAA
ncbi:WbuC family cupin fold metalloprotein [Elioraea sp.]|uniref:WbuC family cupin fold metalloprotein n=1 Tax=Elioraea sp. TaxID=2185103 RepID=UPI003F70D784